MLKNNKKITKNTTIVGFTKWWSKFFKYLSAADDESSTLESMRDDSNNYDSGICKSNESNVC